MGVKGLRSSGTGSRRGLKESNLGPGATDRVTTDSQKATSISGKPGLSDDLLDGLSHSHGRGETRDKPRSGVGRTASPPPSSAKATGSIEVHLTLWVSRNWWMLVSIACYWLAME